MQCHPSVKAWVQWAKFEMSLGDVARCRAVYEDAVETMEREVDVDQLYVKFAQFEELVKEPERARAIYKYALDATQGEGAGSVQGVYHVREAVRRPRGHRGHHRGEAEGQVRRRRSSSQPDVLRLVFDYTRMEEQHGDVEKAREVYERAIANVPPQNEKRYWKRTYSSGSITPSLRRSTRRIRSERERCTASA